MKRKITDRGYLLPEIIDPGQYKCLVVFIPDDDFYLRAFSGQLERLTTWQIWEKDGTTRAAQAAQIWKDAVDYTHEFGWIGACEMLSEECCNALIEAINNISIALNCGGGGGETLKEWRVPSDWEEGLPAELPPLVTEPTTVSSGNLCDNANQTWSGIRDIIDRFPDFTLGESGGYDELYAYLQAKAQWLIPPSAILFSVMNAVTGAFYSLLEQDTLDFWDEFKEEFICAILDHSNAQSFYFWLKTAVSESAPNLQVRIWLDAILQMPDWNLLYDDMYDAEPEFVGSDCTFCIESTLVVWDFADNADGWVAQSRTSYDGTNEAMNTHPKDGVEPDPTGMTMNVPGIGTKAGESSTVVRLDSLSLHVNEDPIVPNGFSLGKFVRVTVTYYDDTTWQFDITEEGIHELSGFLTNKELRDSTGGASCINIAGHSGGSSANGAFLIDNIVAGFTFL